jgi:hypothetical protein
MKAKIRKPLPYEFVLDELATLSPTVRPMFGCHAVYHNEKILLVLRQKEDYTKDNGVWIATVPEHHASLRREFPSMRRIFLLADGGETSWQNLPEESPDFEEAVLHLCKLARQGDPRVGKIPKRKKPKARKPVKAKLKPRSKSKPGKKTPSKTARPRR